MPNYDVENTLRDAVAHHQRRVAELEADVERLRALLRRHNPALVRRYLEQEWEKGSDIKQKGVGDD